MPVNTGNRNRRWVERNRQLVFNHLSSHPCVDCGEADVVVLEFDHVRGSKLKSVNELIRRTASLELIEDEIAKCEVRCANCHRRATYARLPIATWRNRLIPQEVLREKQYRRGEHHGRAVYSQEFLDHAMLVWQENLQSSAPRGYTAIAKELGIPPSYFHALVNMARNVRPDVSRKSRTPPA